MAQNKDTGPGSQTVLGYLYKIRSHYFMAVNWSFLIPKTDILKQIINQDDCWLNLNSAGFFGT